MSKTYAARRLLEHGCLSFMEFWVITGWAKDEAKQVLADLIRRREVEEVFHNGVSVAYALAETA